MAATVVLARGVCDRSGADGPARQVGLGRVFVAPRVWDGYKSSHDSL